MKEYFTKYLEQNGGKIAGSFGVNADQQDFTAALTQIKQLNSSVIWFDGLIPLGVRIRLQMDKLGCTSQSQSVSGIISDAFFIEGAGKLAEGTIAFREGEPVEKLPGGKWFMEEYQKTAYKKEAPRRLRAFRLRGHEHGSRRGGEILTQAQGQGRHRLAGQGQGLRLHRGQGYLRRPRPEHLVGHLQVRGAGRQVGALG